MDDDTPASKGLRRLARWALGATLLTTGTGHLTVAREEFQAQVPSWVPADADLVVIASGLAELGLGAALLAARGRWVPVVGWTVAGFFVAIFPGNVAQYVEGTDMYGLDSDRDRFIRLFFQPVLVGWALWSTDAWARWRARHDDE